MKHKLDPVIVGLDLNATRGRAVAGAASPRTLALDGEHAELPLYLGLERRQVVVGRAARACCRRVPHLVCADFLALLCTPYAWKTSRHTLDAAQAATLLLKTVAAALPTNHGVALTYPGYLSRAQATQLARCAEEARLPLGCLISAPLAAASIAHAQQANSGPTVILDVDDHALTLTMVMPDAERVQVLERENYPHLGLRACRERLLDAVADRCIRRSRRDPRESSEAEQALWEQLDGVLAACAQNRLADLAIQAGQWYHDLVLRPDEVTAFTSKFTAQALEAVRLLLHREARPIPSAVVLTAAAGRLPGLVTALQESLEQPSAEAATADPSDDFGENLLQAPTGETTLTVLHEDTVARAAWELAAAAQRGHFDSAAPLLAISRSPNQARRFGTIA